VARGGGDGTRATHLLNENTDRARRMVVASCEFVSSQNLSAMMKQPTESCTCALRRSSVLIMSPFKYVNRFLYFRIKLFHIVSGSPGQSTTM
jgi:hypothetical protein